MEYIERVTSNSILLAFLILMLFCIIKGARKGMLKIIYGIVSWIFLLIFVNYACGVVSEYINQNTSVPTMMQESIGNHLMEKYEESEQEEAGTGEDAILRLIPPVIKETIDETIHNSIEATIKLISKELSDSAIHGISMIISVIAAGLILFILGKIINLVGYVPVIRDVNMLLGVFAGFGEGLLITWLCMYIADCFPTSDIGAYVIEHVQCDPLLLHVYQINIIERIIGI